jgi:hypothetical protein
MPVILAQARLQRNTNKPEDVVINTFHFLTTGAILPTDVDGVMEMVARFYNDTRPGSTQTLAARMTTDHMAQGAVHEVRVFNLSLPKPREPIGSELFELVGLSGLGAMPAEVAVVLSYRAAPFGQPSVPARRRGRLYHGPLSTSWLGTPGVGDSRPAQAALTPLLWAGRGLIEAPVGSAVWAVYSQTEGIARPVTEVSYDNAFDTQRRRGAAPTLRVKHPA